ncbi:MAG: YihY/virulence factor BrkB family protein [wastewater metagenome]|nr:YihY/virulence factor BrkB family protein [Candidatus Loosdrechtia aerotolerans]
MALKRMKHFINFIKIIFSEFSEDNATRLAAAIAYYTIFALAPLLIIVIAIIGLVFGKEIAQGKIIDQFQNLVGEDGADAIKTMVEAAAKPKAGIIATVAGIAALLFGAGNLFIQLQDSLNTVWEVTPKPEYGIRSMIRNRFLSLAMVLGTGFLLLVSLIISTGLEAFSGFLEGVFPGLEYISTITHFVISIGFITLLFALIFKILPDAKISWGDVWFGALITAVLFTIGKYLIGVYLGHSAPASMYGAAGSLVILLLWVYYSAIILLLGTEFTQVYANRYGSRVVPEEYAIPLTEAMRKQQRLPQKEGIRKGGVEKREEPARPPSEKERVGAYAVEPQLAEKPRFSCYTLSFICLITGMVVGNRNSQMIDRKTRKESEFLKQA